MKRILIIGASSGIGKALAVQYAAEGNIVGITGRREGLLREIKELNPSNILTSTFDVKDEHCLEKIDELIADMQGLDILVYSSGIGHLGTKPDWALDHDVLHTNAIACVKICGHIFNYFIDKPSGQIAIVSSIAALRGGGSAPAYNASKALVSSYAESLNMQAAILGKPIVVTDVKPGFVDTAMAKGEGKFWVMPVEKVARQIIKAINSKKRKVVVTKRWRLVAALMKYMPSSVFLFLTRKMAKRRMQS